MSQFLFALLQKYDLTLERFAQNFLNQLQGCPLKHNPNDIYGENLYRTSGANINFESIVQYWYNEVSYYDYQSNTCNAPEGEFCGHYTQVRLLSAFPHNCINTSAILICVCSSGCMGWQWKGGVWNEKMHNTYTGGL